MEDYLAARDREGSIIAEKDPDAASADLDAPFQAPSVERLAVHLVA